MSKAQRYRLPHLRGMVFERRPVSSPPPVECLILLDCGTFDRTNGRVPAVWKDGAWTGLNSKPLGIEPTFWTVVLDA